MDTVIRELDDAELDLVQGGARSTSADVAFTTFLLGGYGFFGPVGMGAAVTVEAALVVGAAISTLQR